MKMLNYVSPLLIATVLIAGGAPLSGDESNERLKTPGFRPQSKLADSFLKQLDSSRIAVLPTLIRTRQGAVHSDASQKAVVGFLKKNKLGVPEMREAELDMGKPQGKGQYDLFMNDLKTIGKVVAKQSDVDYFVVMEHLVTPTPKGDIAIGGIHIYVLDAKGKNAFSFLLNSHHKIFVEAKLRSADSSKQGRDALVLNGTKAALSALEQQIKAARGNK
jgi:hypothetical protein